MVTDIVTKVLFYRPPSKLLSTTPLEECFANKVAPTILNKGFNYDIIFFINK